MRRQFLCMLGIAFTVGGISESPQFRDAAAISRHSHHAAQSEGSRCISCHMPRIMDALLFRARYHQIDDIPNAEMTKRFGQEESPNACLLCHTQKDAEWAGQQLSNWKAL